MLITQSHPAESTVGITLARYSISQGASVHAVGGQGIDPTCPASVADAALALLSGQVSTSRLFMDTE